MTDDELWTLLLRHTNGRMTTADAERLRAWVEADPARADVVRRAEQVAAAARSAPRAMDSDDPWVALRARIERDVPRARRFTAAERFAPGRGKWRARAAAALVLLAAGAAGVEATRAIVEHRSPGPEREFRTGRGERAEITLSDGSRVTLGAESRLRAPERFGGKRRDLQLEGEAYFRVAHDASHPFVVHVANAAVRAVGTEFDVRRYPEDTAVRVVVAEGRVALRAGDAAPESAAMLVRGDVGELDARGTVALVRRDVGASDYLGWMSGRLAYRRAPIAAIAADLSRWYGIDVRIADPRLARAHVTVTLPPADTDAAGHLLAEVLGARYERVGRTITLSPSRP